MKEQELRAAAKCALCGHPFGKSGLPMFWRVRIERHALKARAVQAQQGLAMFLGSAVLAQVMGPDEDMTERFMEPVEFTVCESCCTKQTCVAALAEAAGEEQP